MEAMASNTYDRRKGSRFVARIFALLALAAVAVVVVAVVSNSLTGSTEPVQKPKHAVSPPKPPRITETKERFIPLHMM